LNSTSLPRPSIFVVTVIEEPSAVTAYVSVIFGP